VYLNGYLWIFSVLSEDPASIQSRDTAESDTANIEIEIQTSCVGFTSARLGEGDYLCKPNLSVLWLGGG
jgi:hypothetical protein